MAEDAQPDFDFKITEYDGRSEIRDPFEGEIGTVYDKTFDPWHEDDREIGELTLQPIVDEFDFML